MKKILFLFVFLFSHQIFSQNLNHDQIIDAIRYSKLEVLKEILSNTPISKEAQKIYTKFAQEIVEERNFNFKNFGKVGIPITDEHLIPVLTQTKWQKIFHKTGSVMKNVGSLSAIISIFTTFRYFFKEASEATKLTPAQAQALISQAHTTGAAIKISTSLSDFEKTYKSMAVMCGSAAVVVAGDFLMKHNDPNTKEFKLKTLDELFYDSLLIKELIRNQNTLQIGQAQ